MLIGSGLQALTTLGKFKPAVLGEIQAAGDRPYCSCCGAYRESALLDGLN
jgi:hypothetical protein